MNICRHILAALALMLLVSCENTQNNLEPREEDPAMAEVAISTIIPLPTLPSRAGTVTNDTELQDYYFWIFVGNEFHEEILPTDTYTDAEGKVSSKVRLLDDGTLYLALEEGLTNVRVMMLANHKATKPSDGESLSATETRLSTTEKFSYNSTTGFMPMYGINNQAFDVTQGADGGVIQLIRAMAKIEVRASHKDGLFTLTNFYVVNGNSEATLRDASACPSASNDKIEGASIASEIDADGFYCGYMYLPEVGNIKNADSYTTSTSLIIEGDYASPTNPEVSYHRYYRLDFIRIDSENDGVQNFTVLEAIERNHRYIFSIDYLAPTAGWSTLEEALAHEPENIIDDSKTHLAIINQEEIKSVTTDQFVYLGVTSDVLTASESESSTGYYWARFYAITNNPQGWKLDELPDGVSVTVSEWTGDTEAQVPVIVWIDKTKYSSGDKIALLVFSSRIRKTITILIP